MTQFKRELHVVGVADHVVEQHDATHPGQGGASGHFGETTGVRKFLGAGFDLLENSFFTQILKPTSVTVG